MSIRQRIKWTVRTVVMVVAMVVVRPAAATAGAGGRGRVRVLLLRLLQQAPHHPLALLLLQQAQRVELPSGPAPLPLLVPGVALAVDKEPALWVNGWDRVSAAPACRLSTNG